MGIFIKIKNLVKKIPKGRVTTYGEIARALKTNPQVVGWALHGNKNPAVPCHRVVFKNGSLASGYVFGGKKAQKEKLKKEGVRFLNQNRVDLLVNFWTPILSQGDFFRRRKIR